MYILKKLLVILSICLLLFSFGGCECNRTSAINKQAQLDSPPALNILYQDKIIEAIKEAYSWTIDNNDGTICTMHADSSSIPPLTNNLTSLTVSPKSSLTLGFSNEPTNIAFTAWMDNKPIEQSVTDDKIVTSELKGSIIYEVIGTWEQGTVSYAFLVNVE